MFFLTKGILEKLVKRRSLFDVSSTISQRVTDSSVIRLNYGDMLCIVKCTSIKVAKNTYFTSVNLYDGLRNERVLVNLAESIHNIESSEHNLEEGVVVLVNEIAMLNSVDIFRDRGNQSNDESSAEHNAILEDLDLLQNDRPLILLKNFVLLGKETIKTSTNKASVQSQSIQSSCSQNSIGNTSLEVDINPLYKISDLKYDYSYTNWSIKGRATAKSIKLPFTNSNTFEQGHRMRVQLFDGLNYIELVAFNAEIEKLESLEVGHLYLVENGNIRASKASTRTWPNQKENSLYDIIVRSDTSFTHLSKGGTLLNESKEEASSSSDEDESVRSNKQKETVHTSQEADVTDDEESIESNIRDVKAMRTNQQADNCGLELTKIVRLCSISPGTRINIIAIIHEIMPVKTIRDRYGNPLEILNMLLIDKDRVTCQLAIWGEEAKLFHWKANDCIQLNGVEVITYAGGRSLSKLKNTSMSNVSRSNLRYVQELKQWLSDWKVKKEKSTTMASYYQIYIKHKNNDMGAGMSSKNEIELPRKKFKKKY